MTSAVPLILSTLSHMQPPGVVGWPRAGGLFPPRIARPLCRLASSGAASFGNLDWQSSHCQKEGKHPTLIQWGMGGGV